MDAALLRLIEILKDELASDHIYTNCGCDYIDIDGKFCGAGEDCPCKKSYELSQKLDDLKLNW